VFKHGANLFLNVEQAGAIFIAASISIFLFGSNPPESAAYSAPVSSLPSRVATIERLRGRGNLT
jgi:hypothetical protein